jgi:hypothetical protein
MDNVSEDEDPVLELYYIRVFDDGNQRYKDLPNEWIITSNCKQGKVSIKNLNGRDIINSISYWKLSLIV